MVMASRRASSAVLALILLLLLLLLIVGIILLLLHLAHHGRRERCPKFSCDTLHNLTYPFLPKDYPSRCGIPHDLSCNVDNAVLYFNDSTLYVTAIRYQWSFLGDLQTTLQVADPRFSNSACPLPLPSLSMQKLVIDERFSIELESSSWISFLNCSKPIHNNASYIALPCLSHGNSSVYAVQAQTVESLKPSCRYVSMAVSGAVSPMVNSEKDLFRILREQRFNLTEVYTITLKTCIKESLRDRSLLSLPVCLVTSQLLSFLTVILLIFIVFVVPVRFLIAPLIIYIYLGMVLWKRSLTIDSVEQFLQNQKRLSPVRYNYGDLIAITRNFKEKLGEGGFGSVFTGELVGGVPVAVKMLNNSKYDAEDFINEVSTIGRIHHMNIVKLVGFCADGSKRALVYEYMVNGSLEKFIFTSDRANNTYHLFSSKKLIDIALGVARAIDYLHRGCEMRILHFDIKPQNVLLDRHFTPKVADFGLAKLYPRDNSLISLSAARGTIGYIAPELISRSFGTISDKSDVYSFGMLLLKMAGGISNFNRLAETSSRAYYPFWIYDKLDQDIKQEQEGGGGGEIVEVAINEVEKKLSMIGLWCIQLRPAERPTMERVVEMLEADISTLMQMPPKPFFSSMETMPEQYYSHFSSSSTDLSAIIE